MKQLNKKTIIIAAAALAALLAVIVGICAAVSRRPKFYTPEQLGLDPAAAVTLTADHGLAALAPANTTAAFTRAGENGFDGVYFEVRRTADGIWVVLEDENIRCMTDGSGRIGKLTYKQLLQHRVTKGKGLKEYKDEPLTVATLDQALSVCARRNMTPVIEVSPADARRMDELFSRLSYRFNRRCALVFTDGDQLLKAQELLESGTVKLKSDNVQWVRAVKKLNGKTLEEAKKTPDAAVCFSVDETGSAKQIARFLDAGLTLYARGANKPKQIRRLAAAGVGSFITDRLAHREIGAKEEEETTTIRPDATTTPAAATKPATTKPAATKSTTTKSAATTKPAATTKAAATKQAATKSSATTKSATTKESTTTKVNAD